MTEKEIENKLLEFNSDQQAKRVRKYYNQKSFMEILSKSRNENTHSSFIAWLFDDEIFGLSDGSPLMHFLDALVKRDMKGELVDANLKAAILSRSLQFSSVNASTEKLIKDISLIPSTDRIDILVEAMMVKPLSGKKGLRIILENKVFSDEIRITNDSQSGGKMDEGLRRGKNKRQVQVAYPDYYNKSQTERYYYAVAENPIDNDFLNLFVYLSPAGASDPVEQRFSHIFYQDLMDFVLDPLRGDKALDPSVAFYLQEYTRALSVPSISEEDNSFTVLAVSAWERKELHEFWEKYGDLVTEAAKSAQSTSPNPTLKSFWDKNQPLFMAICNAIPNGKSLIKSLSTRDYTKFTLEFDGAVVAEHLGKRQLILAAYKKMIEDKGRIPEPETDDNNRWLCYSKDDFDAKYAKGEISQDTHDNRYSLITCSSGDYYVLNQWGSGNWGWVEENLPNKGFTITAE